MTRGPKFRHHIVEDDLPARSYAQTAPVDLDNDGSLEYVTGQMQGDVFSCEMEGIPGAASPRCYVWENVDGREAEWRERVVLDTNLGGHAAVAGDVTGNSLPDIIAKPWSPHPSNAVGGNGSVVLLENVTPG